MHAVVLQAGIAFPFVLLLTVYTLLRREKTTLHWLLSGLLLAISCWIFVIGLQYGPLEDSSSGLARGLGQLAGCAMVPLFVLTMGHWARIAALEHSRAVQLAILVPFACFYAAILTNDLHHLVFRTTVSPVRVHPREAAGPLFWAYMAWAYLGIAAGTGICLRVLIRDHSPVNRRRAWLILAAIAAPVLAHSTHLLRILPIDYPLTPAALGITALLLVTAVRRYGLLESAPVVRRDVIAHLSDGLVLADAEGLVVDCNPAAERILGREHASLVGQPLEDALEVLRRADGSSREIALRDASGAEGKRETEIEVSDGRVIEVSVGSVRARESQPAGRFVVLRDHTAQRRGERLLRQRQKLESVGILAAGVAHEVNNPLAFVRANLGHLQQLAKLAERRPRTQGVHQEADELEELPDIVGECLDGLDRIGRIVEDLLRLARPPSEDTARVDVNAVAREAIRFATLHRTQNVVVETGLRDGLPPVDASADRLVQVLLNLLLNAKLALAGQPGGRVVVETARAGDDVEIHVRDNGPGVPPELRERIFDPFFTTRGPGEGTGLGLSIAFDILREHKGTLEVTSPPGEGACFTLRLPAAASLP